MNHSCEVCKKKIEEPLYWADPKFYDIPKKVFFCDAKCSLIYYKKIKKLFKKQEIQYIYLCKFCTAKFYYLQFDFRKKISINHQSKTSSILIPILTYSSGASFI